MKSCLRHILTDRSYIPVQRMIPVLSADLEARLQANKAPNCCLLFQYYDCLLLIFCRSLTVLTSPSGLPVPIIRFL